MDMEQHGKDLHDIKNAMNDVRLLMATMVDQNKNFISKVMSREIGQFPPDSVPLDIFNKVINRTLILCGAIVFAALGSVGYVSQRANDKAAEVATQSAQVLEKAVTKAAETKP